jgi:hypothetical protein
MRPFSPGIAAVVAGSRFPVIGGSSQRRENQRLIERERLSRTFSATSMVFLSEPSPSCAHRVVGKSPRRNL